MKTNKALALSLGILPAVPGIAQDRPNVLIIHCDQLAAWTLGCYGGSEIETPNIDRLASDGVMLTNFYANTPVSTPSRGCLQTGLYPNEHGAFKNDLQIRQDVSTFASELRDAGYFTGYAGKWHLDGNPKRPGWDIRGKEMGWTDRSSMYSFGHYKEIVKDSEGKPLFTKAISGDPEHYPTDWFTDRAIEMMENSSGKPFCVMLSIPDPHGPYLVRSPYDKMYPEESIRLPKTLTEMPKDDNFLYWESRGKKDPKTGVLEYDTILSNIRKDKSLYLGSIKCIDDNVGRILDYLETRGIYDNTIVVFTADHGDMMGEHARMAKAVPFESAARIPMIIRYPKKIDAAVCTNVASCIDFYPTVLSLAGVSSKAVVSGHDMSTFICRDGNGEWEDVAYLRSYSQNYPWLCAVTGRYKLIFGEKEEPGEALLLDRKKDPDESRNFYHNKKYQKVAEELTEKLVRYCKEHKDPHWKWMQKQISE